MRTSLGMALVLMVGAWLVQGAFLLGLVWAASHWLLTPLLGWPALSLGQAALVAVLLLLLAGLLRRG